MLYVVGLVRARRPGLGPPRVSRTGRAQDDGRSRLYPLRHSRLRKSDQRLLRGAAVVIHPSSRTSAICARWRNSAPALIAPATSRIGLAKAPLTARRCET